MARPRIAHVCSACGAISPKWQGQCPQCDSWNTLSEAAARDGHSSGFAPLARPEPVQALDGIAVAETPRVSTRIEEFDRVLGGGLVPGGVVLIGGDPGIGKSTLLLQALAGIAGASEAARVLYVTGEESPAQVALRARRLAVDGRGVRLLAETSLERIESTLEAEKPHVAVVDSIQTVVGAHLQSAPGSVAQVRDCASRLTRLAKSSGISLVLVGHVTKEGALAGPRVLEHIVDTVLYFEGDSHSSLRLVRAFKNRFGAVNEIGVFGMTDRGLRGVANPSAIFLSGHGGDGKGGQVAGSCVLATQEGTRPMLVELQALVDDARVPNPRRLCVGLDGQRLAMLLAVLHRHAGVTCHDQDVFANAVGGARIIEPAADLAVLLAIVSSRHNRPLPRGLVVFGEVGLAGEIRPAPRGQERLREAAKLGFSLAVIPAANAPRQPIEGLRVVTCDRLADALARLDG